MPFRTASRTILSSLLLPVFAAGIFVVAYSQSQTQIGYAVLSPNTGGPAPVAAALFTYSNSSGIIVSQAGVGSAPPFLHGRVFVDERGTQTAVALVNTSAQTATVNATLRDPMGMIAGQTSLTLNPGEHRSVFIFQLFGTLPQDFTGSATFDSNQPLSAITLRQRYNSFNEPLYATLPVVDLSAQGDSQLVFPHLAAGAGYVTQLLLFNRGSQTANGQVRFFASDGSPLVLQVNGNNVSQQTYTIPPDGVSPLELQSSATQTVTGYAVLTPSAGGTAPAGTVVFRFVKDNAVITEAAVGAVRPTTLSRIYVDYLGSKTGFALVNSAQQSASVTLKLLDRYGIADSTTTITLSAGAHIAEFVDQVFNDVSDGFSGLLEIQSTIPITPITLKLILNARGDQILTTLPVADLTATPATSPVFLPQIAIGQGFSTRLVLLHPGAAVDANGQLRFVNNDGTPLQLPLGSGMGDTFGYQIPVGNGRQLYPGIAATVGSIALLDAGTGQPTTELYLNAGTSIRPRVRIVDTTGTVRDDFDAAFTSLDSHVATVDQHGLVQAVAAGFSSIVISVGNVLSTATVTVANVQSGVPGYNVLGVAQDFANHLYLAATQDNTILRVDDLAVAPVVYAGVPKTAGLKNDLKLQSLFRQPSYIVFEGSTGSLYVSDSANNAIRRVRPGSSDLVETVAGTGAPGSLDGPGAQANFNNPQGIALDNSGYLWIADSGNNTIRRLNLVTGVVETIAGKAGNAGNADGVGDQASFRNPSGIAVVTETPDEQLARELQGAPPPPVEVVVADTGNNAIRSVDANGNVVTYTSGGPSSRQRGLRPFAFAAQASPDVGTPLDLHSPTGIAVDPSGNIYFTEPVTRRVRVLLRRGTGSKSGNLVDATPPNTSSPQSLIVGPNGDVVITDAVQSVQKIQFGAPQITSLNPPRISTLGGDTLNITGSNFAANAKVSIGGIAQPDAVVVDSQTIRVATPLLSSGTTTVAVSTRAGRAAKSLFVDAPRLTALPPGFVTTVAGGGGYFGDGGHPASATIVAPGGLALGPGGIVYSAEPLFHRVRKIDRSRGVITTVAGNGQEGFSGDGKPAVGATLSTPMAVTVDRTGNLFIADTGNRRIRMVDVKTGIISTVAGTGMKGFGGDNGPAKLALLSAPEGIVADSKDNLFIIDAGSHVVRRIDAQTGIITTVAGNGNPGFSGDGGPATSASLNFAPEFQVRGLAVDRKGDLLIADTGNNRIRVVDPTGTIFTLVGGGTIQTSFGTIAGPSFATPNGIFIEPAGSLLIADTGNQAVRRFYPDNGSTVLIAGTGTRGFSGDSQLATSANLNFPNSIVEDTSGNIIISDQFNYRIRVVEPKGQRINTLAGTGDVAFVGDGKPADDIALGSVDGLIVDAKGNIIFPDRVTQRIRRIDGITQLVTTLLGNGTLGFVGLPAFPADTALNLPTGVTIDSTGNVYFADNGNNRILRIDAATGVVSTVAGTGRKGFGGDNGPAASALLNLRGSFRRRNEVVIDAAGNLYFTDTGNQRVRRIDASTKTITTVAGNGVADFTGDGGPAAAASLDDPSGLVLDSSGNLFIADALNHRVRRVDASSKVITTFAGSGPTGLGLGQFGGDDGPATAAQLNVPIGLAFDRGGNLFIADALNNRVRKVDATSSVITTAAGTGIAGFSGDGTSAVQSRFNFPWSLAFDAAGNLYVADTQNHRIRAIRGPLP
jgi:sugar lactone lactonase YvrE